HRADIDDSHRGPTPRSDLLAGSAQPSERPVVRGLILRPLVWVGAVELVARPRDVDVLRELRLLGEDGHAVLRHRQEPAVHRYPQVVATFLLYAYRKPGRERRDQRDVPGQNPQLTVDRTRVDRRGFT